MHIKHLFKLVIDNKRILACILKIKIKITILKLKQRMTFTC
jgi:hypothetical protein